jgi:hypothetical protein
MSIKSIGVVYLCRAAENEDSFVKFVDSYKANPANCQHDLIIIFKGFEGLDSKRENTKAIFSGLDYKTYDLLDEGFDIGSYLSVARSTNYDYLFFLNTHSYILSENWLKLIYQSIEDPSIGLVGTSASYESNFTNHMFIQHFLKLYQTGRISQKCKSLEYYRLIIPEKKPPKDCIGLKYRIKDFLNKLFKTQNLIRDAQTLELKEIYPPFPNPHIRSNGFFIDRSLLLDLCGDLQIVTKNDAYAFECGYSSLTRKIWHKKLRTVIVGKNGVVYDVHDWPESNTFGLGAQENLLISDNQISYFKNFSEKERVLFTWLKWGDCSYVKHEPFQKYGFKMKSFKSIEEFN